MATGAKITGAVTRWWWVRHAPVPNPGAPLLRPVATWIATSATRRCSVTRRRCCPRARSGTRPICCARARPPSIWPRPAPRWASCMIDPDLAEQHFGDWQGLTYVEIAENHADNHLFWLGPPEFRPPGGESFVDLRDRTIAQHRPADRRASRPRHRGDGAWRHDPRGARPRLRPASRGGGALRDRQCLDHADRAFRAGRSRACLARRLRQLHAARTRHRPRRACVTSAAKSDRRAGGRAGRLLERAGRAGLARPPWQRIERGIGRFRHDACSRWPPTPSRVRRRSTSAAAPAARRRRWPKPVGAEGHVLGVDISEALIDAAATRTACQCDLRASAMPRRIRSRRRPPISSSRASASCSSPIRSRPSANLRRALKPVGPPGLRLLAHAAGESLGPRAGAARPRRSCRRCRGPARKIPASIAFGDRARVERILTEAGFAAPRDRAARSAGVDGQGRRRRPGQCRPLRSAGPRLRRCRRPSRSPRRRPPSPKR